MTLMSGQDYLAKKICDALGLKHVRKLDIHFEKNKIATVEAVFALEIDGVMQFPAILKRFNLIEIEEKKEATS